MQIDYELISMYGTRKTRISDATEEMETLISEGYVEEQEVIDIAKKHNVVILYEITESSGYSEIILINNKGEHVDGVTFSVDTVSTIKEESKGKSMSELFEKDALDKAYTHMREHDIGEKEFMEQYLDELYLDMYESKRDVLLSNIKSYYKK